MTDDELPPPHELEQLARSLSMDGALGRRDAQVNDRQTFAEYEVQMAEHAAEVLRQAAQLQNEQAEAFETGKVRFRSRRRDESPVEVLEAAAALEEFRPSKWWGDQSV